MASKGRKVGARDLRLKLQRKSIEQSSQFVRGPGGGRDLREKLSGALYSRPVEYKPPAVRPKPVTEASKPTRKSVIAQAPARQEARVSTSVSKKKVQQKVKCYHLIPLTVLGRESILSPNNLI